MRSFYITVALVFSSLFVTANKDKPTAINIEGANKDRPTATAIGAANNTKPTAIVAEGANKNRPAKDKGAKDKSTKAKASKKTKKSDSTVDAPTPPKPRSSSDDRRLTIRPVVEPYFGMDTGSLDYGRAGEDNSAQGRIYGIRGMLQIWKIFFGGDHGAGKSVVVFENSGSFADLEYDFADTGFVLGLEHKGIKNRALRVWYVKLFRTRGIDQDGDQLKGSDGYKVGVGLKMFSFVSFNLEYITRNYDEDTFVTTGKVDYSYETYSGTMSFPFP